MKKIIIAIVIVIVPLFGTILSRSTFEAWEGSLNWTTYTGGNGDIRKEAEDFNPNSYQTQAHGKWSMKIKDPDNSSYANAYETFTNSSSEYMIEFYLWIYRTHETIDSFPLCVLWNMPGEGLPHKTDIALVIDTLNNPPNGGLFTIHVQDADSIHHNEAKIDYTDRWYKIQIYRYVSSGDTVVTLYLDGDSIDTYVPMNKDKVSNKISLGTTSNNPRVNGEVFVDDLIITGFSETEKGSNGVSEQRKTMITQVQNVIAQINNYDAFKQYFSKDDVFEMVNLANLLNNNFNDLCNYEKLSYFNELIVKFGQIKLGLLYGNLNDVEKGIVMRSLGHIINIDGNGNYNLIVKGGK